MKNIVFTVIIFASVAFFGIAQNPTGQLDEARSAYQSGNLQDARFALQQAINEIDLMIGKEILGVVPTQLEGFSSNAANDNVTTTGYAGLFVGREYTGPTSGQSASLNIIVDSPLLAGVNAMLAMPMFVADANQKRVRIAGYRGLLQKNTDETTGEVSWDLQLPMGSTLLTFNVRGIAEESKVTEMANQLKIDQIGQYLQ
jgi:hypothetical protein